MNLFEKIRDKVCEIPEGKVSTYGEVARAIGVTDSRKVGWALHQNKDSESCPCHRVVNKEGELAKGFAFGGKEIQKELLKSEGVPFISENKVHLEKCMYKFVKS